MSISGDLARRRCHSANQPPSPPTSRRQPPSADHQCRRRTNRPAVSQPARTPTGAVIMRWHDSVMNAISRHLLAFATGSGSHPNTPRMRARASEYKRPLCTSLFSELTRTNASFTNQLGLCAIHKRQPKRRHIELAVPGRGGAGDSPYTPAGRRPSGGAEPFSVPAPLSDPYLRRKRRPGPGGRHFTPSSNNSRPFRRDKWAEIRRNTAHMTNDRTATLVGSNGAIGRAE